VLGTKGKRKGQPVPDANLRDTENVPLGAAKHSPPQIKQRAHERQGTAVTNFATTLPEIHANLAARLAERSLPFSTS